MANGADEGSAFVVLSKWNTINQSQDVIAAATINLPGSVSNWTAFDIPLNYILTDAPDTATIYFTSSAGSPVDGSYLYVDNVAFAGTAAGINTISPQIMIDVYPNPASDFIYILKTTSEKETKFEISSIVGNIVQSGILKNSRTKIELKNLSKGVYFVTILSANHISNVMKVVIE